MALHGEVSTAARGSHHGHSPWTPVHPHYRPHRVLCARTTGKPDMNSKLNEGDQVISMPIFGGRTKEQNDSDLIDRG